MSGDIDAVPPCTGYLAQATLHGLSCTGYLAQATLHGLPCTGYLAQATLHRLRRLVGVAQLGLGLGLGLPPCTGYADWLRSSSARQGAYRPRNRTGKEED